MSSIEKGEPQLIVSSPKRAAKRPITLREAKDAQGISVPNLNEKRRKLKKQKSTHHQRSDSGSEIGPTTGGTLGGGTLGGTGSTLATSIGRSPRFVEPSISQWRNYSLAPGQDEVGLSVMSWSGQDEIKATSWATLNELHFKKIYHVFRRILRIKIPDLSQPIMNSSEFKLISSVETKEKGPLYEAKAALVAFLFAFSEPLDELSSILAFLPLPWEMNTIAEIYHFKWLKVSFTVPFEVEYFAELADTYRKVLELFCKTDEETRKKKGENKKFLMFGKGNKSKTLSKKIGDTEVSAEKASKHFEKSLSPKESLWIQTFKNYAHFSQKYCSDPNSIIVGSQPCQAILDDLFHLSVLSKMAKQQKEFGALIKMMKTNFEDSTREEKEKKKKKDEKKKEKKEKESSARTTVMTSRLDKRGRSQRDTETTQQILQSPEEKKESAFIEDTCSHVPVACLNYQIGYFPSREQMVQRMVLWSKMVKGPDKVGLVEREVKELAEILRAELWLEQVWQERGGTLFIGDILIGIFPDEEFPNFEGFAGGEESHPQFAHATNTSTESMMFCRFVGAKRNGLMVEIAVHGAVHGEPIFLTWKQAIPLPDKWREKIKCGSVDDIVQLVSPDTQVLSPSTIRIRSETSRKGTVVGSGRE